MQFRSEQYVFIGYSSNQKGYLCLASSGKIYVSRHVIFDEPLFPFYVNSHFLNMSSNNSVSCTISLLFEPPIPILSSMPAISCTNRFSVLANDHDNTVVTDVSPPKNLVQSHNPTIPPIVA